MTKPKFHRFLWQHKLIGFFRNVDFPGFRKLSLMLPKWILPHSEKFEAFVLQIPSGYKLWIHPSIDRGVERSLFETGIYERGTLDFIKTHLKIGDTFVDVGANIGLMSIFAREKVGDKGKVWAFEANSNTFDILEKNLDLNKFSDVLCFECGLGAKRESKILYDNWDINRGAASTVVQGHGAKAMEISILTLDEVVNQQGISPSMIKIDVEGMEEEVLIGAEKTIANHQPILIVEFSIDRGDGAREKVFHKILSLGNYNMYKLKGSKERTSKLLKINGLVDLPVDDNVFCIPNKKSLK